MKKYLVLLVLFALGCGSSFLKYEKEDQLKNNDEFEKAVQIEMPPEPVVVPETVATPTTPAKTEGKGVKAKEASSKAKVVEKKPGKAAAVVAPERKLKREPDLEDSQGFEGRRPLVDPFRVGEVVTHNVHYFKVSAGDLHLKVEPFVQVNGKRAYAFATEVKTSSLFSSFYSVDDRAVTLLDFEELIPRVFTLHVKESGQLREARSYFDFNKNQATYWEKKVTKKKGAEEKKLQWEILPYSQNVFSAIFYMRVFKWEVGKEIAFRVADDEENLVFRGRPLREKLLILSLVP